ncbi:MAG: FecR family protein [Terriglobia bacterium]|jgi:ferric-dicitrate binding protein FerR (iron transport regulator)
MLQQSRVRYVFPGVFGCLLLLSPAIFAAGEGALGMVRSSHAASLGGAPVPGAEVIFDGDLLTTSEGGNALVELNPGTQVRIAEKTSVRFVRDGKEVRAELVSGVVVSESAGKATVVVTTPNYQFAPAQEGKCRYAVQLSQEQTTVAAAINGNVIVKSARVNASYVLPEGKYAAISASAVGVPGQSVAAGAPPEAPHAGTVRNAVPDDVVQRQGQGAETTLKGEDGIDAGDIVMTKQNGRLQIVLADGSLLNIGTGSTLKIAQYDPQTRRVQIELTSGHMRVRVGKLSQPGSSWTVHTPTAVAGVVGTDSIVEAQPNATTVLCVEGLASVRNIDPAITGHVILYAGQFTTVPRGAAPSGPQRPTDLVLQNQIDQTAVGPPEPGGPGAAMPEAKVGWHIGSLSEAESVGLIVGAAAGAAAAIAIPLAIASPSSL